MAFLSPSDTMIYAVHISTVQKDIYQKKWIGLYPFTILVYIASVAGKRRELTNTHKKKKVNSSWSLYYANKLIYFLLVHPKLISFSFNFSNFACSKCCF